MHIIVNGDPVTLPDGASVQDLIRLLCLEDAKLAIEVNQAIVPRSAHANQRLQDQDCVEIVHAIGGG